MSRAPVDINDLPGELKKREAELKKAIGRGIRNGVRRGRSLLVHRTPKDMGLLKASWRDTTARSLDSVVTEIFNDAPYAGIVEEGARPHGVNAAGRLALTEWAERHFPGLDPKAIKSIVFAIIEKLRVEGQKPTHFVRNSRVDLARILVDEIVRALTSVADQPRAR